MQPLAGITILDLSRVLAGPFCTMRLADLGARVIKVESRSGDTTRGFGPPFVDGESPYFMSFNRGKESVVLDLKEKSGWEFVCRVLKSADVIVENFRPGVMERLGLSDAFLEENFPRLIRAGITGFGPLSPRSSEAAFDLAIQAESGLMAMNGEAGREACRVPISIADLSAGSAAVEGILAALLHRERGGHGCRIDISLMESLVALFGYQVQGTLMTGESPRKMGHRHPNLVPYQGFATADGMIVLAVAQDLQWQRLLLVEDMPASLANEKWCKNEGRVLEREDLERILQSTFVTRTTKEWVERLKHHDIPVGPVRSVGQMLDELKEAPCEFLRDYEHKTLGPMKMMSSPILWQGRERDATSQPPPTLGQHSRALFEEFAENEEEVLRWLQDSTESSP